MYNHHRYINIQWGAVLSNKIRGKDGGSYRHSNYTEGANRQIGTRIRVHGPPALPLEPFPVKSWDTDKLNGGALPCFLVYKVTVLVFANASSTTFHRKP